MLWKINKKCGGRSPLEAVALRVRLILDEPLMAGCVMND